MYKIPLEELKEKIVASGKLSQEDLDEKIKAKIGELSGLISEEGATHIIANELNVEVVAEGKDKLKIKEIYAGMNAVSVLVKVVQKYETREFNSNGRSGKVASLFVGDETGSTRLTFWNDKVDLLDGIKEDDVLLVKEAYVKENKGRKELHMGRNASIDVNPEGESVEVAKRAAQTFARKTIQELEGGEEGVELLGTVVQVFDPRFFRLCSDCNKRVTETDSGATCAEHGAVIPQLSYVLNAIIDDGSGNIRTVFWKNQTNNLLGMSEDDLAEFESDMSSFENVKSELLGEQFNLSGKVKKNDMFNHWSTPIYHDRHLYGMFSFKKYGDGPLQCIELITGKIKWSHDGYGPGNVILSGDNLIALADDGFLAVVKASPSKYHELARKKILNGKCWSTPILSNGLVLARSTEEAVCIDARTR